MPAFFHYYLLPCTCDLVDVVPAENNEVLLISYPDVPERKYWATKGLNEEG